MSNYHLGLKSRGEGSGMAVGCGHTQGWASHQEKLSAEDGRGPRAEPWGTLLFRNLVEAENTTKEIGVSCCQRNRNQRVCN